MVHRKAYTSEDSRHTFCQVSNPWLPHQLSIFCYKSLDNNVNVHACTNFSVQKLGSLVNDLLQSLLCRRVSKAWQWENIGGSCTSIINVYTRCLRKVDISFRSSSVKYCCLVCNSSSSSVLHVHACNKCNKWIRTPVYASSNNRSNITKEQKNGYTCSYQYVQGWRQLHV